MMRRALEPEWVTPLPGDAIAGKYVVETLCGSNSVAAILSATQSGFDQRVAVKVLLPQWASEAGVIEGFLREGHTATRIRSEHMAHVFEVGRLTSGAPYTVFEYLEGHTLEQVVANWGPLPVTTAVDWVLQAAEAIAEAYVQGVVVRDLRPVDLFLVRRADGSECVKLVDLGLSKPTIPHPYESNADEHAAIQTIGALLYELMTGETAFQDTFGETSDAAPTKIASAPVHIPPAVHGAVLRCLTPDPSARFATLIEMAYGLAPFGTAEARGSCEHVARVRATSLEAAEITPLPPLPLNEAALVRVSGSPNLDDMQLARRAIGSPASARVVMGAFLMLAGLGAGAFMFMYRSVHGGDARTVGVTALQPTENGAQPRASAAPIPVIPAVSIAVSSARPSDPATPVDQPVPKPVADPGPAPPVVALPTALAPKHVGPSPASPPHVRREPRAAAASRPSSPNATRPNRSPQPRVAPAPTASPQAVEIPARPSPLTPTPAVTAEHPANVDSDDHDDFVPAKPPPSGDDLFDGRK
jgi:hypothetical protein